MLTRAVTNNSLILKNTYLMHTISTWFHSWKQVNACSLPFWLQTWPSIILMFLLQALPQGEWKVKIYFLWHRRESSEAWVPCCLSPGHRASGRLTAHRPEGTPLRSPRHAPWSLTFSHQRGLRRRPALQSSSNQSKVCGSRGGVWILNHRMNAKKISG